MSEVITVVGREVNELDFVMAITNWLPDNFSVDGVHSLGDRSHVDGKERFIAFIQAQEDVPGFTASSIVSRIVTVTDFSAKVFASLEQAVEDAKKNYGFGEEEAAHQARVQEVMENFPALKAAEIEQFILFDLMYSNGRLSIMRGRYLDEPVVIMASVVRGPDETRATPLAILFTDSMLQSVELPGVDIQ